MHIHLHIIKYIYNYTYINIHDYEQSIMIKHIKNNQTYV